MVFKSKALLSVIYTFVIVLLIAAVIIIGSLISKNSSSKQELKIQPPCQSQKCTELAVEISDKMNFTNKPCEDFYDFVCGGKEKTKNIETDKTGAGIIQNHQEYVHKKLQELLTQPQEEDELNIFKYSKQFYSDCTDLNLLEEKGKSSLLSVFEEAGGFPVLDPNWDDESFSWENLTFKFLELGLNIHYLFQASFTGHPSNSSIQQLFLLQPSFRVPLQGREKEYLGKGWDSDIAPKLKDYFKDLVILLGANETDADDQMREVVDFQIKLANIFLKHEHRLDKNYYYNQHTIAEVQQMYDWVDWKFYLNTIASPFIQFDDDYILNVYDKLYFDALGNLLKLTPKRVMANFFFVQAYLDSLNYLGTDFRNRKEMFVKEVEGQVVFEERKAFCTKLVIYILDIRMGPFLVQKHTNYQDTVNKTKEPVLEIIKNLNASLVTKIKETNWMDATTKQEAIQKVESMKFEIGYPEEVVNNTFLKMYFENFSIVPGDPYKTFLAITKFDTMKEYEKVVNPEAAAWTTFSVLAVDVVYAIQENKIKIPIAILQDNYIDSERPNYINYGSIATLIGHSMMHAFDTVGREYDSIGTFRQWWTQNSDKKYMDKIKCLKDQYDSTIDPQTKLQLRGDATVQTSFSDTSGVKVAYDAYKLYTAEHGVEPKLKTGKVKRFNSDQLFWISMGQLWCSKSVNEKQKNKIVSGAHPPDLYRVLFPLKNNEDFAKDFKCKPNTAMNPNEKCSIWENTSKSFFEKFIDYIWGN